MKLSVPVALAVTLFASGAYAQQACVYPQAPQQIPNGAQASKDEMVAANGQVKEYSKAVQEVYLPCLEKEKNDALAALDNMDPEYTAKKTVIESLHAKRHNAALDELTALAGRWSEEIKAFNSKDKK